MSPAPPNAQHAHSRKAERGRVCLRLSLRFSETRLWPGAPVASRRGAWGRTQPAWRPAPSPACDGWGVPAPGRRGGSLPGAGAEGAEERAGRAGAGDRRGQARRLPEAGERAKEGRRAAGARRRVLRAPRRRRRPGCTARSGAHGPQPSGRKRQAAAEARALALTCGAGPSPRRRRRTGGIRRPDALQPSRPGSASDSARAPAPWRPAGSRSTDFQKKR